MTRSTGLWALACFPLAAFAQGGDKELRSKADALFTQGAYAQAMPLYSQLVSLEPSDRDLSFRYGACSLYGGEDKEKAIGFLKYATEGPATSALAWYFLGKAYHLTYHFTEALAAYEHYRGTADKKMLTEHPVDALEQQCRNGQNLLSNLKDIEVHNKVEVDAAEFFRFYDLSDIGGKIVVTPDELKTTLDKKSKATGLIYLPANGGPIYFSSLGKDGRTGRDIYRTELLPSGEFATPVKLAGYINTNEDEDYACMAPDGKSFYFSSKGHNSMGGYDVFKSTYDKASDVFGAPENMDFAVNTPDDDVFYLVDPQGKEACFASGRDSKQGMLHVYRVATTQSPINITVLKGTFASQLDPNDRKAHITVEDALTREQVADVRTDINGSYVLALPRSGKYKFMVQAGPSGRTHAGMVEVPRSEEPRAYRQEMLLIDQGGEKLMIKNYFDEPLQEDIIALALDEIKRRAHLDVTGTGVVAQQPEAETPKGDAMTQAGFAGNLTVQDAVQMAKDDLASATKEAQQQGEQAQAAYTLSMANAAEAEHAADHARDLVAQAANTTDDARKNDLMMEAARERQHSREANMRAGAAHRAADDLQTTRQATLQRADRAGRLSADLTQAVKGNNAEGTLAALKSLKAQRDEREGPNGHLDAAEQIRQATAEKEKDAAKKLQQANARRSDETELADRIANKKREEAGAKGAKKEQLTKDIAQLEEQHGYLVKEADEAFAKAKEAERDAALARGESKLAEHLGRDTTKVQGEAPDKEHIATLGRRIGEVESRIASTAVDERYDAAIAAGDATAVERRAFDWDGPGVLASGTGTRNTKAAQPSDPSAQRNSTGTVARRTPDAQEASPPATNATAANNDQQDRGANTPPNEAPSRSTEAPPAIAQGHANDGTETASMRGIATPVHPHDVAEESASATGNAKAVDPEEETFLLSNQLAELHQLRAVEKDKVRQDSLDQAIASVQQRMRSAQEPPAAPVIAQEPPSVATDAPELSALEFDPASLDSLLVEDIYPGFLRDRRRIAAQEGDPQERATALRGLETMLVDSIDAQVARQLAVVEHAPDKASTILPRVDRLRKLRDEHAKAAVAPDAPIAQATPVRPDTASTNAPASSEEEAPTPHNDSYISIAHGRDRIYESVVEHRSSKVAEAVAQKDKDLEQLVRMEETIDSLETVLDVTPAGNGYDKLRKRADRLIDDHLILRTEMGQRMDHIMQDEYAAAQDSSSKLSKQMAVKGLSAEEPLARKAEAMEKEAREAMDLGAALHQRADRSEDIVLRDSLYRQAYAEELGALRSMDRAQTMRNFMLRDDFQHGQDLSYAEVERRMFDRATSPAWSGAEGVQASTVPANIGTKVDTTARSVLPPVASAVSEPIPAAKAGTPAPPDTLAHAIVPAPAATVQPAAPDTAEQARITAEREALKKHLSQFYFLSGEEQQLVLNEEDRSRYFTTKVKSLDQRSQATTDRTNAADSLHQADAFQQEAQALRQVSTSTDAAQRAQQADQLAQRSARARAHADSLKNAADDLERAAGVNDSQAAVLLQGLPAERSTAIMAMEQRTRKPAPPATNAVTASVPAASPARPSNVPVRPVPKDTAHVAAVEHPVVAQRPAPVDTAHVQPVVAQRTMPPPPVERPHPVGQPRTATVPRPVVPPPAERTVPPAPRADTPLAADVFSFSDGAAKRTAPIAIDAPMPTGVVFKVQVGAFKKAIGNEAFTDMTPVAGERTESGFIRYTAGMFTNAESAAHAAQQVRERGYHDAFVVAYQDGRRIPLRQARQLVQGALVAQAVPLAAAVPPSVPVTPAAPMAATPEEDVLKSYPASAADVLATFKPAPDAAAYYNDPTAAPAKQVEMIKGLFFTVQVGVYSKPTALDRLFNITPLNSERTETGKIRYTTGIFLDLDKAKARKDGTVGLGVTDAFVTAYLNGKRIPMRDARALLGRFGAGVLADPALATH